MVFVDDLKELRDVDCRSDCDGIGSLDGRGTDERVDAPGELFTSAISSDTSCRR
jgi:hypothetical protein